MLNNRKQFGFTLMEILVATTIFATTVTMMLGLFNYTLKINRRVQGLRQVAQGTRNFTEIITREIRNGQIDYASPDPNCSASNYSSATNTSLGLVDLNGERVCFYYDNTTQKGSLMMSKNTPSGLISEAINPANFKVNSKQLAFIVRPTTNPYNSAYPGVQPFVTFTANFEVQLSVNDPVITIPYQTTISTDVYDVPHP